MTEIGKSAKHSQAGLASGLGHRVPGRSVKLVTSLFGPDSHMSLSSPILSNFPESKPVSSIFPSAKLRACPASHPGHPLPSAR